MNLGKTFKRIFNPRPTEEYVSDIDKFMEEFNKTHEKSKSQLHEIKKHQRVANMRDNAVVPDLKDKIWEDSGLV